MNYKNLVDLGFERYEMGDGFDELGIYDFYLFLKVSKEITFEWHWKSKDFVKMVHYKKSDVQNYIKIMDLETLKVMINLYREKTGNDEPKSKLGKDDSNKTSESSTSGPYYA